MIELLSRWVHIFSAVLALGGLIFALRVLLPSAEELPREQRAAFLDRAAERFRPVALAAIAGGLLSGFYNFYRAMQEGVSSNYHMAFGVKFLLALHLFAILYLVTKPAGGGARDAKRPRLIAGAVASGMIILALGAYLKSLHG